MTDDKIESAIDVLVRWTVGDAMIWKPESGWGLDDVVGFACDVELSNGDVQDVRVARLYSLLPWFDAYTLCVDHRQVCTIRKLVKPLWVACKENYTRGLKRQADKAVDTFLTEKTE